MPRAGITAGAEAQEPWESGLRKTGCSVSCLVQVLFFKLGFLDFSLVRCTFICSLKTVRSKGAGFAGRLRTPRHRSGWGCPPSLQAGYLQGNHPPSNSHLSRPSPFGQQMTLERKRPPASLTWPLAFPWARSSQCPHPGSLRLPSLPRDTNLTTNPLPSSDSSSFWFCWKADRERSGRTQRDCTHTLPTFWVGDKPLCTRPSSFGFFFSFLSAGQRGSLSSLSWPMSPHLWTHHYLLRGEASFETHLAGNKRRRAGGDTMPRVPKPRSVPTAFLCTTSSILPERVLSGLALTSPKRQRATSLALTPMVGLRHVSS